MNEQTSVAPGDLESESGAFFVAGGTLARNAACYVTRAADKELLTATTQGEYCYILTSRQMGKSSLMVRTARRLRDGGDQVAVLDLTAIGQNLSPEQWYDGLLSAVGEQIGIEDDLEDYWLENERIAPMRRFFDALRQVALPQLKGRLILFVDEVDSVQSLPFSTDEFFAGIRECWNRRTEDSIMHRLVFGLFGVAAPSDLIRDTRMTPFNIGRRIELTDFTLSEAQPLAEALGTYGSHLLQRVFYWTGGHPYLTLRVCQNIARRNQAPTAEFPAIRSDKDVDELVSLLFFTSRSRASDDNLLFVRERILRGAGTDLGGLLTLYRHVRSGKQVVDDESDQIITLLRLSGLTKLQKSALKVRNLIYGTVFDRAWIESSMPDGEIRRQRQAFNQGMFRAAAVAIAVLLGMGSMGWEAMVHEKAANQERLRALKLEQREHEARAEAERLEGEYLEALDVAGHQRIRLTKVDRKFPYYQFDRDSDSLKYLPNHDVSWAVQEPGGKRYVAPHLRHAQLPPLMPPDGEDPYVVIWALVHPDGHATIVPLADDLDKSRPEMQFLWEKTIPVLKEWEWQPATRNGVPVEGEIIFIIPVSDPKLTAFRHGLDVASPLPSSLWKASPRQIDLAEMEEDPQ